MCSGLPQIVNGSSGANPRAGRISVAKYTRLCVPSAVGRASVAPFVVEPLPVLPSCDNAKRGDGERIENGNDSPEPTKNTTAHILRFELIARTGHARNKFVVRYITSC